MGDELFGPANVKEKMIELFIQYGDNPEQFHIQADELLCDTLRALGYDSAVKIFENADRWYS